MSQTTWGGGVPEDLWSRTPNDVASLPFPPSPTSHPPTMESDFSLGRKWRRAVKLPWWPLADGRMCRRGSPSPACPELCNSTRYLVHTSVTKVQPRRLRNGRAVCDRPETQALAYYHSPTGRVPDEKTLDPTRPKSPLPNCRQTSHQPRGFPSRSRTT